MINVFLQLRMFRCIIIQACRVVIHFKRIGTLKSIVHALGFTVDDLEKFENPETKKSPAPAEAETEEMLSVKEVIDAFVKAGFVPEGQDLTDADLRFIIAMGEAFTRWFESKQDSA